MDAAFLMTTTKGVVVAVLRDALREHTDHRETSRMLLARV
jgi:hypothetical protein